MEEYLRNTENIENPEPKQSYRKSGPQINAGHQVPADTYVPEISLYEESMKEMQEQHRANSRFYRFLAAVLILSLVGAPFLGLGLGMGVRLFDSYFLPILLDDSSERENFAFGVLDATPPVAAVGGAAYRPSYVELVQLVEPSVVLITATVPPDARSGFNFNFGGSISAGSGIIMAETSTRYYIATNAHVIERAQEVHVSIAGSEKIPAVPVGRDDEADLAVIAVYKAEAVRQGVTSVRVAQFGDSSGMQVGEVVLAIGNSMGEGNTVTNGIISAIDREITVSGRHLLVLQTNAAINQGNSGGPLVNLHGQVVGINTAKFSERLAVGMGYAIPSHVAMPILERIMHDFDPVYQRRPMIGITITTLDVYIISDLSEFYLMRGIYEEDLIMPDEGVLIRSVTPGSPADVAGLFRYDIVTAVDGSPVSTNEELIEIFSAMEVGDEVTLGIVREGIEVLEITVVLGPNTSPF